MELILVWLVMATVCAVIASAKGYSGPGWFLYGFLIWPVALVHVLVKQPTPEKLRERTGDTRQCPFCAEMIKPQAVVCRHCGRDLPAPPAAAAGASIAEPMSPKSRDLGPWIGIALAILILCALIW